MAKKQSTRTCARDGDDDCDRVIDVLQPVIDLAEACAAVSSGAAADRRAKAEIAARFDLAAALRPRSLESVSALLLIAHSSLRAAQDDPDAVRRADRAVYAALSGLGMIAKRGDFVQNLAAILMDADEAKFAGLARLPWEDEQRQRQARS